MKIDYLGHSEMIIRLENNKWNEVSIMSDSWLSSYCVWDLMGRNPYFTLDYTKLEWLDAIFLSHAHTDHIDPYTLIDIYKNLQNKPQLIISETIIYLEPLFRKYLPKVDIITLYNKNSIQVEWITLEGFVFEHENVSNEDDVMWLFISNNTEIIFTEVDVVPWENVYNHEYLYEKFTQNNYDSVVYLATRNELEWNMKIFDIPNKQERLTFGKEYIMSRREEMEYDYMKHAHNYVEYPDITSLPSFIRIYLWQGLVYPPQLDSDFLQLSLLSLEDNVRLDRWFASRYWKSFSIDCLKPLQTTEIVYWNVASRTSTDIYIESDYIQKEKNIDFFKQRKLYITPLNYRWTKLVYSKKVEFSRKNNLHIWEIHSILNTKFLNYWFWNSELNLKNSILSLPNKEYIISCKIVEGSKYKEVFFVYNFSQTGFILQTEKNNLKKNHQISEEYWIDDLIDFLEWRQELYSNFFHTLDPNMTYRLWTVLWANFINNDIVYKKYEYHFKLASEWKTSEDFVKKYYT